MYVQLIGHGILQMIFWCVYVDESFCMLIKNPLLRFPMWTNGYTWASIMIMMWRFTGDRSLFKPMMTQFTGYSIRHSAAMINFLFLEPFNHFRQWNFRMWNGRGVKRTSTLGAKWTSFGGKMEWCHFAPFHFAPQCHFALTYHVPFCPRDYVWRKATIGPFY